MNKDKRKLADLITEAYMFGANDSADIYLYVSNRMNVTFEDIDKAACEIFGPLNMTSAAPDNYRLN